ncbi:hypothetical protein [Halarcobacter bivalviorum]|uniref:Uncharacterized protein n=1 Tax=Halarcobacter bivalviorum TaxID=663364 RepID=A0AAX2A5V9_9BACT|nr:hypothetical protein [Halarcobacter bivalviorum]AXH11622.1 hypothetical protein ABIV_0609 [Halarcobacter bivalviorum]RXK08947.1 hypothetical protein CRV05_12965 [Halarcobacter bivalviorum]
MEKKNTEKLKEVLSQTISKENIEKKLKENTKSSDRPKTSSNTKKQKTINPAHSIPKVSPQAKPKIRNTNKIRFINYIVYSLSLIIIITLSAIIYYLLEKKVLETEPKVVEKEVIIEKVVEQQPKEIEVIKEVEVVKEKVVTKVVDLDNKNFRKFYYTQKTKILRCYDFKADSSLLTKECQERITNFVKNTKNLTRIEIIAVVADEDNVVYNEIKDDIQNQPKHVQKRVREYLIRGFSRERVIETASFIRDNLNEYAVVTPTNYYVKSAKDNKGVIIKGFYTTESK